MMEHGGCIINVTSDAGQVGYPGWGAYGISKFGLEGMSQTWASELEETGVRVNWVDPGNMNTAMHRAAEPEEDPKEWANPANVTDVFVFLASDESKNVKRPNVPSAGRLESHVGVCLTCQAAKQFCKIVRMKPIPPPCCLFLVSLFPQRYRVAERKWNGRRNRAWTINFFPHYLLPLLSVRPVDKEDTGSQRARSIFARRQIWFARCFD